MDISLGLIEGVAKLWLRVRPWRRLKVWRNKKRAAKGKPLLQLSEDDMALFPKGTMRKSGVAALAASPFVGMVAGVAARALGYGDECTPEAIEAGCITAEAAAQSLGNIIGGVVGLVGGFLYWKGFNRAQAPK